MSALLWPRHLRAAKLCMPGARAWFAQRDWSWSDFVSNGRPVQDFVDTGCPLAMRAVAEVNKETTDGR